MPGDQRQLHSPQLPQKSLTFFLSGYYGQGNLGDDLLLRATIEGICRISPAPHFVIRNEGDVALLKGAAVPVELTGIDRIASDQTKSKVRRLVSTLAAYRRHLRQCDWFVFGGGTVFHERSSVVPLAMTLLVCLLARLMGVRIAALGVGVATLRSAMGRFLLRYIIWLSDVFAVRDAAALAECTRARAGHRVMLTSDLVFTMAGGLRGLGEVSSSMGVPVVGISVYSPALLHPEAGDRISAVMRDVLETVLVRGWQVVLMAFHHSHEDSKTRLDHSALKRLGEDVSPEYRNQIRHVVLDAANMTEIFDVFSEISVHCGMRFHGHVLSAIFERPFVGVAVDNKIDAICGFFEMPVVNLDKISADAVVNAIDQAIASRIDPALLAKCEEAAEANFSLLAARLAVLQPARPQPRRRVGRMTDRTPLIAVHGYGTYAISYRHMIEFAKTEASHVQWAMLLPTSHHLDVVSEVLDAERILCLEYEQSRASLSMPNEVELAGYRGNIFTDIEAEKKVFKHRPAAEQLMLAVQIYRIYKDFLLRLKPTHLLMAHIETFDGKVLVSLAQELNIPVLIPTDLRHLGGIYFSRDVQEQIPDYRQIVPEGREWAAKTIAAFRAKPGPAFAPDMFLATGEDLLPIGRKSLPKRAWGFVSRTWKNPRLFESELFLTSLKYTFPGIVEGFRSMRGYLNGLNYDSKELTELPPRFIYYPLQVTPESSINTPAPYYVDQMRAIDAIRFAMPSDWTLVVKEHRASLGIRPTSFYRALRQKAGVHIAHATMSSIELIKKAKVTISVTGSATLEAFLLGRPALVLGGCFIADYLGGVCSIDELPSRIAASASSPPDDQKIASTLAEIHSVRHECVFRPADEPGYYGNRAENVRRMIGAVLDHIKRLDMMDDRRGALGNQSS